MYSPQGSNGASHTADEGEGGRESKIYAGWATLAVVMWSWGRATGGANANKGVSTAHMVPQYSTIHTWY